MELFKKKTATDKAIDILTNALHDDEISSFIVLIKKKQNSTILSVSGDLFSQAISLVYARRKNSFKRIEHLADVMEQAIKDNKKEDGKESPKDTPDDREI